MMATSNHRKYLTTSHYTPSPSIMRNERMEKVIAYLNKHYTESIWTVVLVRALLKSV